MPEKRFIGTKECAEYLDVSINTIRTWVWQRQIPFVKMGRLVKFDLKELEQWLKKRKVEKKV
jgi:excisionase family DNA binding protein